MYKKWQTGLFIVTGFLLGSVNVLYSIGFYIFLLVAFLINLRGDFKGFVRNVFQEWKYLSLPLIGVVYLVVHYLFSLIFKTEISSCKPSWNTVELLLLYFFFIPLFLLSARNFVTARVLYYFLFSLCWGILVFNFVKLFYITGLSIFTDPVNVVGELYSGRFGGNLPLWGRTVYLEPQAIYLVGAALISCFFILKEARSNGNKLVLWSSIFIFIFSFLFLSFTVTKGAILAFCAGMIVLFVIYFLKMTWRSRMILGGVFLLIFIGFYLAMPQNYRVRMVEMKHEIENVNQGTFDGGSIGPRAGLMKENLSHLNQFGLLGLGVYRNTITRLWYENSPYIKVEVTNAHNSFMEFWLRGGIAGLAFILYFFMAPVLRMKRRKQFSFLLLALILAFFIANNTCILIILVNSSPFVIMILAMAYLYSDQFYDLQDSNQNE